MRNIYQPILIGLVFLCAGICVLTGCGQRDKNIEGDRYDGPGKALEFELERTRNPVTGRVPWDKLRIAIDQTELSKETARTESIMALSWSERGPNGDFQGSSGNSRPPGQQTSGRIRSIMVDSLDPTHKTVFAGSVSGGLFKTTDITVSPANWTLVNDFLSNLAVADLAQDPRPGFHHIMYMATGESYGNSDAVRGVGVFKSVDAGNTWDFLPNTSAFYAGTRIVCDYQGNVYLGTRNTGLRRSTDGGASWTDITPSGIGNSICDIDISTTGGPARLHIATGIFSTSGYRYTDNPATVTSATWTSPTTPFTTFNQRTEIGIQGNVLIACPNNASHQIPTVWKSIDGGDNWFATTAQPTTNWASGQGWYNISVGINPNNTDEIIVGALDCHKTINGGTTWTKITSWATTTQQYVHADQHEIQWYDGGSKLIFACDGGIHYSSNGGTTITDRNKGLRIKQFYSVAIHPVETNYFIAGAQDNGMHRLNHVGLDSSLEFYGGDGAYCAIDQDEPQYQFGSYVYNVYRRSTNNGVSWSTPVNSSTTGRFINPWDYDNLGNIIYACNAAGNFRRWNNPQTGNTTEIVSVSAFGGGNVSAVHVSPYTPNRVYFGMGSGGIIVVNDANTGTTLTGTSITPAGASGYCNSIVTGSSDQHLIATYSSYGVVNVWVSTNGGTSWTNSEGNLPDMPVRWALYHPDSDTKAFIATETGVWETELLNGGSTVWTANSTFPNVRTDMIKYRASDRTIAAGTHGRGVWSAVVAPPSGFTFNTPGAVTANCPAPATMDIVLGTTSNGGFTNPVSLSATGNPPGTTVSFIPSSTVIPGNSVTVRLSGTNTLPPGTYNINVLGTTVGAPNQTVALTYIINLGAGPAITNQPFNQTICAGSNTSFSITAATATSFQWEVSTDGGSTWTTVTNGGTYSGATSNTMNLANVPGSLNGNRYRAIATTVCGSSTSSQALLTVNTAPAITTQPQNAGTCTGSSLTFTVAATGSSLTYQWQVSTNGGGSWANVTNGGEYSGATTSGLTITGVTIGLNNNQYRVVITGICPVTPVTSNAATLSVATSLTITNQPGDVTTCEGNNTSFAVTATGASIYQWQVSTDGGTAYTNVTNGGVYSGATTPTLNLTGVTAGLNGNRYRVNLSSGCGNVTSNAVLLTVNTLPAISSQPVSNILCVGSSNTFSVAATGTGITYQWQISNNGCAGPWANIPGATSSSYTLTGITAGQNNTAYRVVIIGTCMPALTSNCALLTVVTPVSITTQPVNQTICEGSNTSFTVAGSGAGVIYQWQVSTDGGSTWITVNDGGIYSGTTTGTLSITGATFSLNNNRYRAQLSNPTCTTPATSNAAILKVNTLPAISNHPLNATICAGGSNSFNVSATGTGITYQWQISTDGGATYTNITGATASSYTVSGATATMNNDRYRVIVSGTCAPDATSNAAILTVTNPVTIGTHPANQQGCSGSTATYTVNATSTETVIYQWQVSTNGGATWNSIPGATNSSYTLTGLDVIMHSNQYRVLVSNSTCSTPTASNAAVLTVRQLPTVELTATPSASILPGQVATLTAIPSATTGGTLTTSWYRDGAAFANAGNSFVADVNSLGSYQVKIQEVWPGGLTCFNESPIVVITAPASSKLFIFPSPNDGQFRISYYNNQGAGTSRIISIFDGRGAKIYGAKFPIVGPYTLLDIDLRPAQRGIYYVVVGDANGTKLADGKVMVNW